MKRKIYFILILLFAGSTFLFAQRKAQVGYNADNTAKIDVPAAACAEARSVKKGMFMPRLTYAQRMLLKVDNRAVSLCVYQSDSVEGFNQGLYTWKGNEWEYLNPSNTLVIVDSTGEVQQLRFAKVAMTGNYNDLVDAPDFSVPGSGNNGENISFSRVAYTGSYNDLLNKPEIPAALTGLKQIALTGEYNDLVVDPQIPVRLSDLKSDEFATTITESQRRQWNEASNKTIPTQLQALAQDAEHRTITAAQKEAWNTYAQKTIPTSLNDLSNDEYYKILTQAEKSKWDTSSTRKVPTKLSDLRQDEFAQLVTDAEIAKWDSATRRVIPTSLRELEGDAEHRTITTSQKESWDRHAALTFPTYVGDFTEDVYFKKATLEEKNKWTRQAETPVPTKLSELRQDEFAQLVTDAEIAKWDSATRRVIPTSLRELESDAEHRAITTAQKEVWDQHAAVTIPSYVGDLASDNYYKSITLEDRKRWEEKANTPIPTHLSQLTQDEFAQLVTDDDIRKWNTAIARYIPTRLRELESSDNGRPVTDAEIARWGKYATALNFSGNYNDLTDLPQIPLHVQDLSNAYDDRYLFVTYQDRNLWNEAAKRKPIDSLCQLTDDDSEYKLVSQSSINKWNEMVDKKYPDYNQLYPRSIHFIETGDPSQMVGYRSVSEFGKTGDWSLLRDDSVVNPRKPVFIENAAYMTNNYNDLSERSKYQFVAITGAPENGNVNILNKETGLIYDYILGKPDLNMDFARTADAQYLDGIPKYLNSFDPSTTAQHVAESELSQWEQARLSLFDVGYTASNTPVYGQYGNFAFSDYAIELPVNSSGSGVKAGTYTYNTNELNNIINNSSNLTSSFKSRVVTKWLADTLDGLQLQKVKYTNCIPQVGMVMMSVVEPDEKKDMWNGCWKIFSAMAGRFPVGTGQGPSEEYSEAITYSRGSKGGTETSQLSRENLPPHSHRASFYQASDGKIGHLAGSNKNFEGSAINSTLVSTTKTNKTTCRPIPLKSDGTPDKENYAYYDHPAPNYGYHNNLPPYYTVYFIQYTKSGCK